MGMETEKAAGGERSEERDPRYRCKLKLLARPFLRFNPVVARQDLKLLLGNDSFSTVFSYPYIVVHMVFAFVELFCNLSARYRVLTSIEAFCYAAPSRTGSRR